MEKSFNLSKNSILTDKEICFILSISKATLKNWIRLKKISPDVDGKFFSSEYIGKISEDIHSDKNEKLKSRRNKKNISGKLLYKDYITNPQNRAVVEKLISMVELSESELSLLLANFAIQLYYQKKKIAFKKNDVLYDFIANHSYEDEEFFKLIKDLLKGISLNFDKSKILQSMMTNYLQFVPTEDSLGFIYISLKDIGKRKFSGIYYTPKKIITEMIENLNLSSFNDKIMFCDPCCGTGNFLISLYENFKDRSELYGQDNDPISIYLARINLFLINPKLTAKYLKKHLKIGDTLLDTFNEKFDIIIGNPPWGNNFQKESFIKYKQKYKTAIGKNIDIYDLFVEHSLEMLKSNGSLFFVLPESILNISSHKIIRQILLEKCSFRYISYLGNIFHGIQCPAILLYISLYNSGIKYDCNVSIGKNKFTISKNRKLNSEIFSFNISDEENECINAIENIKNAVYLKDRAQFALGIVTGNNKKYIISEPKDGYEIILKGNNIYRYSIRTGENYIHYAPKQFQQIAPIEIYRAKEKLLYRFISDIPIFAYDNNEMLSLNSCNIVIPMIPELSIKYILAILNSSVVAYWTSKKFHTIKHLKSNIEKIPIPLVSKDIQKNIEKKVDYIMQSKKDINNLFWDLDNNILSLYNLSNNNKSIIYKFLDGKNLFL